MSQCRRELLSTCEADLGLKSTKYCLLFNVIFHNTISLQFVALSSAYSVFQLMKFQSSVAVIDVISVIKMGVFHPLSLMFISLDWLSDINCH